MKDILKEIEYKSQAHGYEKPYFSNWQTAGKFKYKGAVIKFCDMRSGCGPIQMFNYSYSHTRGGIDDFKLLFKNLMRAYIEMLQIGDLSIKGGETVTPTRTPVSIMFVQGVYSNTSFFDIMADLGFEIRIYQNIAHGHNSRDKQAFLYLDVKKEYIDKKRW